MLKLATVFSGIGAIEHALKRMNLPYEIVFACDNGDINIFNKKIPNDFEQITKEFENVKKIIMNYPNIMDEYLKVERQFNDINKIIDDINYDDFIYHSTDVINHVIYNITNTKKKSQFKKLYINSKNINNDYILFNIIELMKKIFNYFYKNNKKISDNMNTEKFLETDGIDWNCIKEHMIYCNTFMQKEYIIQLVKSIKDTKERLSMIFEKIEIENVNSILAEIKDPKQKKEYIDKLYSPYKKQNKVMQSYMSNYDIKDSDFYWDVSFLDGKIYNKKIDLFVGGSPCQSFSLVGKQRGLEDTRGTLFYEFARLVDEIEPKIFIYENVKAVLSNDNGRTWEIMQNVFKELEYDFYPMILNSKDYGIPQNRERLFVVGFRKDIKLQKPFKDPPRKILKKYMKEFLIDNNSGKYYLGTKGVDFVTDEKNLKKQYTQIDGDIQLCQKKNQQFNWHGDFVFIDEELSKKILTQDLEKYFLSEKVTKYVLSTGTKSFYSKPKVDLDIARPLLTSMHKMHRAGVDNYVTTNGRLRKLTPRECLRLMGFCDNFKIVVSDTAMYQQAGNSIVVDVLIALMDSILESYPSLIDKE